jgi:hypothetical protein
MMRRNATLALTALLLAAPSAGCASDFAVTRPPAPAKTPAATAARTQAVPTLFQLRAKTASLQVSVRVPTRFATKTAAMTANDVTGVVLRLFAKHAAHGTFDYEGAGTVLFTSSGYTWSGGADGDGDHLYTMANVPVSGTDYIVTGHAFAGVTDITKTVAGAAFGRSSNSVAITTGGVTYSDAGTALQLELPLLDGTGNGLDAAATIVDGAEATPVGGANW